MQSIKRHLSTTCRLLLGLVFVVNGLNGFLPFLPQPPAPAEATAFTGALIASGYLFPLLKAIELAGGALLLAGVMVPFALILLAPVVVNIAAFHLFLAPAGMPVVVFLLLTGGYLAWTQRAAFAPLFARRSPRRADERLVAAQAARAV